MPEKAKTKNCIFFYLTIHKIAIKLIGLLHQNLKNVFSPQENVFLNYCGIPDVCRLKNRAFPLPHPVARIHLNQVVPRLKSPSGLCSAYVTQ